jgi:hypothetical protein
VNCWSTGLGRFWREGIMVEGPWITPPPPGLLTGAEVIAGASATVRDFWAWALSNLRSNAVRGMLAEYLVACAVGSRGRPRVDWDAYDVLTPRQERIEVKSAAYLQAWEQRRESAIIFRGLRARSWNPRDGYSGGPFYNADVYVFAVLTATEHVGYDALDTGQWSFWVLPAGTVRQTNQATASGWRGWSSWPGKRCSTRTWRWRSGGRSTVEPDRECCDPR